MKTRATLTSPAVSNIQHVIKSAILANNRVIFHDFVHNKANARKLQDVVASLVVKAPQLLLLDKTPVKEMHLLSRSAVVQTTVVPPEELSESQLEELLAKRRLQSEQVLLTDGSGRMGAISASESSRSKAVGPTVCLSITIEGVPADALVDTGSQSTIISRSMLHDIGRQLKSKGQPVPTLERPTVRLFGKDGAGGGRKLLITAQLQVNIEHDGETTCVTVFVQPDSD